MFHWGSNYTSGSFLTPPGCKWVRDSGFAPLVAFEQWPKKPWLWTLYIGDEKLPSYIGIILSHYKDPYQPTSIVECQQGFERGSFGYISGISLYIEKLPENEKRSILLRIHSEDCTIVSIHIHTYMNLHVCCISGQQCCNYLSCSVRILALQYINNNSEIHRHHV